MGGCLARDRRVYAIEDLLLHESDELQWLPSGPAVPLPADVRAAADTVLAWGAGVFREDAPVTPAALTARQQRHPGYEHHPSVGRQVLPVDGKFAAPPDVAAARGVLKAFAVALFRGALERLGLPPDFIGDVAAQGFGSSALRLNYYDRPGSICGPHTDSTFVTLVCDTSPGLYIAPPGGVGVGGELDWQLAPSRALAAFGGRFLYCLTDGGAAPPLPHKVVSKGPRLSLTFFLRPDADFVFDVPRTDPPVAATYREIIERRAFPPPWEDIFDSLLKPTPA
ncbi:hypothetical protein DIPPA_05030 [Diplonema papillatum]|nr:hypothetical protein DIPPA_05030 [Diplonema papillatum]